MKRHPALAPLSRDHHRVLVVAQGLRSEGLEGLRARLPADAAERTAHVLSLWDLEIDPHFRVEEERLLPALEGRDAALDEQVARVRSEHAAIRALVAELRRGRDLEENLDALGEALVDHVRAEERGLFEVAQQVLADEELQALTEGH